MSTWRLPRFLLWLADQTGEPEQVSPKERQFGTIRKRKNGLFQALYFDLAGKRHTAGMFKTKTAARAALNAIQTDLLRGSWRDPTAGEIKFSIYAESWMNWKATDAAPRTLDQYRSLLRCHLLPAFGTAAIRRITTPMVRDWNAALAKEKAGTARCAYRLLRAILNAALEDGLVPANPCKVKGAGSDRSPERVPPTVAEVQALMRAMPPHLHAAVMVAAHVPIRRNEVLGLKRQDVNLTLGTLTVERQLDECPGQPLGFRATKNKERGTVGLSEEVVAALAHHIDRYVGEIPSAPLFPNRNGGHVRPGSLWRHWNRARSAVGTPPYHFHDLRHFAGTMLSASGASLAEIKKRGRWKSDAMVLRYQHATEDRDALLARATAPFVPIPEPSPLCSAPTPRPNSLPTRAFTPDDAVTSANDEESSGGETRTLNLAGPPEQDQYQHPLE